MALDPAFWLELALKMAMTAAIVVTASVLVERSGPFIGALIAALPTAAGAVYIILAIDHPPSFIAASAVGSMVSNAAVALFALSYAALAQRQGLLVSLGGAFAVWFACAALLHAFDWTAVSALLLNAIVLTATTFAGRRFQTDGPAAKAETQPLRHRMARRRPSRSASPSSRWRATASARSRPACSRCSRWRWAASSSSCIRGSAARRQPASRRTCRRRCSAWCSDFSPCISSPSTIGVWWSYAVGLAIGMAWNGLLWALKQRRRSRRPPSFSSARLWS